jgi:hypothetical protein
MRSGLKLGGLEGGSGLSKGPGQVAIESSAGLNTDPKQGRIDPGKGLNARDGQGVLEGGGGFTNVSLEAGGGFSDTTLEGAGALEGSGGFTDVSLQGSGGFSNTTLEGSSGLESAQGLHAGSSGGTKKGVKTVVKKAPVYVEIICGSPVSGSLHLDIEWVYDEWERLTHRTTVHQAIINDRAWTQETWDDFADAQCVLESGGFSGRLALGTLAAASPHKLVWRHSRARHSPGCEVKFDQPDPHGEITRDLTVSLPLAAGSTADSPYVEAPSGHSVFPDYAQAHLST